MAVEVRFRNPLRMPYTTPSRPNDNWLLAKITSNCPARIGIGICSWQGNTRPLYDPSIPLGAYLCEYLPRAYIEKFFTASLSYEQLYQFQAIGHLTAWTAPGGSGFPRHRR
jgi:hypothetical protein